MKLSQSCQAWGQGQFDDVFKHELAAVPVAQLPLQQGLIHGSYVLDEPPTVMVMRAEADAVSIRVTAGVFFSSVIAGCSCADDPTPVEALSEYCELQVVIERRSGVATAVCVV
ncbi:MAG: hypothetical protein R6X06_07215 [Gammaproteobacteria bacterium]